MNLLLTILLLFATATPKTYSLVWLSEWAIAPETITVEVWGGTAIYTHTADDGKSGQVTAVASKECLSITLHAETTAGFPVTIVRTWTDECYRTSYLPLIGT